MSKIIGYDFQGWPVTMLTLREMLKDLGFKEEDGIIYMLSHDELLDAYPVTLEDDGMGYGVNNQYVTEADREVYEREVITEEAYYDDNGNGKQVIKYRNGKENVNVFNLFREEPHNKIEEGEDVEES